MSGTRFKHAAFAREDVEDARRGHPDFDLRDYAAARGLNYQESGAPPNFENVVPAWPEYVFNAVSGVLPGGEVGVLQHELMEVEVSTAGGNSPRMGGQLFDVVATTKDPFFFQPSYWKGPKNEPFAGNAIWIPTTRLMARVPQAALVPPTKAVQSVRTTPIGRYDLDRHGLPGFSLRYGEEAEDRTFLDRLFSGPAGQLLAGAPYAYVDLDLDSGFVSVRCNGFLRGEEALDALATAFSQIVAGVRETCAPYVDPRPFDEPLPDAPWAVDREHPPSTYHDMVTSPWWEGWRQTAAALGMPLEDPKAYHRAYPTNPVPSAASAVMRGVTPEGRPYRLAFHRTRDSMQSRAAGLFAAPEGWEGPTTTPAFVSETGMWLQGDGAVIACWDATPGPTGVAAPDLLERVRAAAVHGGIHTG